MAKTTHLLGTGYEPHVDETEDGKLLYSLPVESSFVTLSFTFEINEKDLEVLVIDNFKYAALYVVLHTILQNTFGPQFAPPNKVPPQVTQEQFREITSIVLHASDKELDKLFKKLNSDHNTNIEFYIDKFLATKN